MNIFINNNYQFNTPIAIKLTLIFVTTKSGGDRREPGDFDSISKMSGCVDCGVVGTYLVSLVSISFSKVRLSNRLHYVDNDMD